MNELEELIKDLQEIRDKIKNEKAENDISVWIHDLGDGQNKRINNIFVKNGRIEIWVD